MKAKAWVVVVALLMSPVLVVVLVLVFVVISVGGSVGASSTCLPGTTVAIPAVQPGASDGPPAPTGSAAALPSPPASTPTPTPTPTVSSSGAPASVGEGLEVTLTTGATVSLDASQIAVANTIVGVGTSLGVSEAGLTIALMTALQESGLRMWANSTVPESLGYPHEAVGSDHDSLNPFQQRASWGTVAERMDTAYAARAFFGGPAGPNGGAPPGLLDTAGWEAMTPGEAAQAVQVSAFPAAYDKWLPAAQSVLATVGAGSLGAGCASTVAFGAGGGGAVLPLPVGYVMSDDFGPRPSRVAGASTWHPAIDLSMACGTPVYAILPGVVTLSNNLYLSVKSPDGFVISYLHTYKSQHLVDVGDQVTAGTQISVVGSAPPSTGCHLDVRINITGNTNPEVAKLPVGSGAPSYVNPEDFLRLYGIEICPAATCTRNY